ncbi:MAG: hypothetical protein IKI42_10360 [Clostridia bacterium]|nr:hypothetical protein [Clostridia bacterium]
MKKLSSYKTTEGAPWHREGAKNGIRELKNHLTYPESRDDAKIEKTREGALWIIKPIVVKIIQIRISKPYPNLIHIILGIAYVISRHQPQEKRAQNRCPHARVVPRKNVVRTRA